MAAALLLLAAAVLPDASAARADGTQGVVAQAAILPGPLTIPECTPLVVDDVIASGYHLFTTSCRVVDATGSGSGWHVLITGSTASGNGTVTGAPAPQTNTVAEVTSVTQSPLAGAPALKTGTVTYPVPLYTNQAANVFSAAPDSGMGELWLTVDGRISQRQYIRFGDPSLTFSIVAGP